MIFQKKIDQGVYVFLCVSSTSQILRKACSFHSFKGLQFNLLSQLFLWVNILFECLRLVSEALKKMQGKISEIASSHVSSRVLQVIMLTTACSLPYYLQVASQLITLFPNFQVPVIYGLLSSVFLNYRLVLNIVHKMKEMLSSWRFGHILFFLQAILMQFVLLLRC